MDTTGTTEHSELEPRIFGCAASVFSVVDHGAHVLSWRPAGQKDALYLSPMARFDEQSAIRGGVPVILPWFGPGRTGSMTPPHGFVRTARWRLMSSSADDSLAVASFALSQREATSDQWPYPFEAELRIVASSDLDLELTVRNTGSTPVTFEDALHTYLRVGDATAITIEGLEGEPYIDKVDGHMPRMQSGAIVIAGETDRVYTSTSDIVVRDAALNRTLRVRKRGSGSTIVWNPWVERAREVADLPDSGWREFVCVEAGNVGDAAITLGPQESHVLGYRLSVEL